MRRRPGRSSHPPPAKRWRLELEAADPSEESDLLCADAQVLACDASSSEEEEEEEATSSLARWCRAQLREGGAAAAACTEALRAAATVGSHCPRKLLAGLCESAAGRGFLRGCEARCATELEALAPSARGRRSLHVTLASACEARGDVAAAVTHCRRALIEAGLLSEEEEAQAPPDRFDPSPLADRECRAAIDAIDSRGAAPASLRALLSSFVRLRRQQRADAQRAAASKGARCSPGGGPALPAVARVRPVPRAAAGLSAAEFHATYAAAAEPVILRVPAGAGPSTPWDLSFLRERLGAVRPELKRRVRGSVQWAGLEAHGERDQTIADFIDAATSGPVATSAAASAATSTAAATSAAAGSAEPGYLFDWSMPQHCPQLLDDLVVPRYFASDLLQRAPPGSLLREAWPSLFIGPAGSRCSLHVDAFGTHFWMMLFEGRKAWTLFPREATGLLRPSYAHGHDAVFGADVAHSAAAGDDDEGWRSLDRWECILEAGEILFVPAGCAHAVENLTPTAAISANFVAPSNRRLAVDELRVAGLSNPAATRLARALAEMGPRADAGTPAGRGEDLPFREFKGDGGACTRETSATGGGREERGAS